MLIRASPGILFALSGAGIYAGVLALYLLLKHVDRESTFRLSPNDNCIILGAAALAAYLIAFQGLSVWMVPFFVYLLYAFILDAKTQMVYDLLHYPVILGSIGVLAAQLIQHQLSLPSLGLALVGYFLFLGVQYWRHCYGFADTLAYTACGLALCTQAPGRALAPYEILIYLLAISNAAFLVTNLFNFAPKGKTKEPTAFIPCIAFAVMFMAAVICLP